MTNKDHEHARKAPADSMLDEFPRIDQPMFVEQQRSRDALDFLTIGAAATSAK